MTAEQINSLQPGPETDRLVAEAIGLKRNGHWWEGQGHFKALASDTKVLDPMYADETRDHFSPSTDWDDSMFAAEKVSLLRRWWQHPEPCWQGLRFLTQCDHWCVAEWTDETGIGYKVVASGRTGPLAICRAILALK